MDNSSKNYQFSKDWNRAFDIFKEYTTEIDGTFELGIRSSTNYLQQIKRFVKFLGLKELTEVTELDFKNYIAELRRKKRKHNYIAFAVAAVKSGFDLWQELGLVVTNKIAEYKLTGRSRKGKRRKRDDVKDKALSTEALLKIFKTIDSSESKWDIKFKERDWLIIALAYVTGLRAYELSDVYVKFIDFERHGITVIRKGGEEVFVLITDLLKIPYKKDLEQITAYIQDNKINPDNPNDMPKVTKYINDYNLVSEIPNLMEKIKDYIIKKELNPNDRLFGIRDKAIWYRVKKWVVQAKLDEKISTHFMRHTFGTHLGALNVSAFALKTLMNHKDIATTQRYIQLQTSDSGEVLEQMGLFSPESKPLPNNNFKDDKDDINDFK